MYGDELTMVYDSYSVLKTGMDQTGERLPLTFTMGEGRPAGYVYGSIPFVAIFGPSEWGVRGLSFASGMGIIILMYFLGKKLFDKNVGLWASFLTSVSMWDIYLSRAGFEAHFALFLSLLAVVMFLHKKYIFMAILFGISAFTYPTFKLTIPLILSILTLYSGFWEIVKSKKFIASFLILVLFAGVSFKESLNGVSDERFLKINVLSNVKIREEVIQKINEQRTLSDLPEVVKPFVYNKPLKYSRILFESYMENLSPEFLFLRGDRNPRHNPGEWGMLYLADILLLAIGFYSLAKSDSKVFKLILGWVLIVPLATMFLGQTHALRNNFMLPPMLIVLSNALTKIALKYKALILLFIVTQLAFVLTTIYNFAPNKFGSFWSEEAKKASLEASVKSKSENVTLSTDIDNIEFAYPVYAKVDPNEVISQYGKMPKVYGNITISDVKK